MALVIRTIYQTANYYMDKHRDDRLSDRFLMGSMWKPVILLACYVYFVQDLGPKLMKNRKPFELKKTIMTYNIIQVLLNLYVAVTCSIALYLRDDPIYCLKLNFNSKLELHLIYLYYMIKVIDLLDTVFFVLRKKFNQISFLHVYHHAFMVFVTYSFAQYYPGGHFGMVGLINAYVHVFMYFYYFMTSFKSDFKNNIKWKKRMTQIQIAQFTLLFVHFLNPFIFADETCNIPTTLLIFGIAENLFMTLMFLDFYIKTYIKKKPVKQS